MNGLLIIGVWVWKQTEFFILFTIMYVFVHFSALTRETMFNSDNEELSKCWNLSCIISVIIIPAWNAHSISEYNFDKN